MPDWFDAALSAPTPPPATTTPPQPAAGDPPVAAEPPSPGAPAPRADQPRDESGRFTARQPPAPEEQPQEEVAPGEEPEAPPAEPEKPPEPRKFKVKLKVSGQEVEEEVPEEKVLEGYSQSEQKARAADLQFKQAAQATRQVQTILGALQQDPLAVISRLPGGVDSFVERLKSSAPAAFRKALGEDLLGSALDEEILEKQNPGMARLMGEVRSLRAQLAPQQLEQEEAEPQEQPQVDAEVQAHLARLRPIFDGARGALGLPESPLAGALLGEAYQEARAKGAAPKDAEALAQAATARLDGVLGGMKPADLAKRFPKVAAAVRQQLMAEAKAAQAKVAPRPQQQPQPKPAQGNGEKRLLSTKEMDRLLGL